MEDVFSRVVISEEDIARQQAEEDLRLYGSRPKPPDEVDIDESAQLANLPPKRNASEFEAAVDRPAKVRKRRERKAFNYEAVTAMDWNSGASPLEVWLNQSAVPSTAAALDLPDPGGSKEKFIAQEIEEIKVFRNVHLAMAPNHALGQTVYHHCPIFSDNFLLNHESFTLSRKHLRNLQEWAMENATFLKNDIIAHFKESEARTRESSVPLILGKVVVEKPEHEEGVLV